MVDIIILKIKRNEVSDLSRDEIAQYLKDAGYDKDKLEEIVNLIKNEKLDEVYRKLRIHRNKTLENEHEIQKQIDCLDFFLYKLKKEGVNFE